MSKQWIRKSSRTFPQATSVCSILFSTLDLRNSFPLFSVDWFPKFGQWSFRVCFTQTVKTKGNSHFDSFSFCRAETIIAKIKRFLLIFLRFSGQTSSESERNYLRLASSLEFYGIEFHQVSVKVRKTEIFVSPQFSVIWKTKRFGTRAGKRLRRQLWIYN